MGRLLSTCVFVACLLSAAHSLADEPIWIHVSDEVDDITPAEDALGFDLINFQDATPRVVPLTRSSTTSLPPEASTLAELLFGSPTFGDDPLATNGATGSPITFSDRVLGLEAQGRIASDGGSLLGKSISAVGVGVQRRGPIVNDPRLRGSRIGRLPASGSHWVPARMDLDTMLSKIDSRELEDIVVIKGPYSAQRGPGFSFLEFQFLPAPRSDGGFETGGSSSFDFQANGEQWYGRQVLWGGGEDWGIRSAYGHRTGNDYSAGDGTEIPASYNSRDFNVAIGRDLSEDQHVEFHYLRLDQTNVELPGQAYDIDFLVTDGFEVDYVDEYGLWYDRFELDTWFNRTRLNGSSQREGKRRQFPFYDVVSFAGFTDVDSTSTGARLAWSWGDSDAAMLTVGTDVRYVQQELNENNTITFPPIVRPNTNSPIPKSDIANPGLFVECDVSSLERLRLNAGARVDFASADVLEDLANLTSVGNFQLPITDYYGTDELSQNFTLGSIYATSEYELNPCWTLTAGVGYAERPPSLTELYAAETFMFVIQNGLNTVTGDPRLDAEKLIQVDFGFRFDGERFHFGANGFHSWASDYITFENIGVFPSVAIQEQVQLKYVNTNLATFVGTELYSAFDFNKWWDAFGTLSYVEGTDRDRNGAFATIPATPGNPSMQVAGLPRGSASGVVGGAEEPLPSIIPLETRLGIRLHSPNERQHWGLELSMRIVGRQDRVAVSLLESQTPGFSVFDSG